VPSEEITTTPYAAETVVPKLVEVVPEFNFIVPPEASLAFPGILAAFFTYRRKAFPNLAPLYAKEGLENRYEHIISYETDREDADDQVFISSIFIVSVVMVLVKLFIVYSDPSNDVATTLNYLILGMLLGGTVSLLNNLTQTSRKASREILKLKYKIDSQVEKWKKARGSKKTAENNKEE